MRYFLTIAATDNTGGAGIQRDVRVASDFGFWPLSVVTAVTAQNLRNVLSVATIPPEIIEKQLMVCLTEFPVEVLKIGVVYDVPLIKAIASCLRKKTVKHVVIDPVFHASGGYPLLLPEAFPVFIQELLPLADIITPNKSELEFLAGDVCHSFSEARAMAKKLAHKVKCMILLKGGHFEEDLVTDLLISDTMEYAFVHERKPFYSFHGSGCVLSSALACCIGLGHSLPDTLENAVMYTLRSFELTNQP
jgi:hydroxymethylpyrimidine/phosphomethylpyrimidine kinase